MFNKLLGLDKTLFLFLNDKHTIIFDFIMYWASNKLIWIPLYILFIYLLVKFYKKQAFWIILGALLVVGLSDLISVHVFKNVFLRLRPCHDPSIAQFVHLVRNHCGGDYGFYSSHASNHFALATWLGFFLKKKIKLIRLFLILWASLIAYSRIYLGVHFPLDVITGIGMGVLLSWISFQIFIKLPVQINRD